MSKEAIWKVLEFIHQHSEGSCPLCEAEDYPVCGDKKGYENVLSEDAEEWQIDHYESCPVIYLEEACARLKEQPKCKTCGGSGEVDDTIRSVRAGIDINKLCPVCQDLKKPPEPTVENLAKVLNPQPTEQLAPKGPPAGSTAKFVKLFRSVIKDSKYKPNSPVVSSLQGLSEEACDRLEPLETEKENHKNAHIVLNKLCNETLAENKQLEIANTALTQARAAQGERIAELEASLQASREIARGHRDRELANAQKCAKYYELIKQLYIEINKLQADLTVKGERIKELEERHKTYYERIGDALKDVRQRRNSGEPALSDKKEIAKLQAEVEQLKAELEKHRWIPVSERLPENDDCVLYVVSGSWFYKGYYESCGRWFAEHGCPEDEVTHWKPIILSEPDRAVDLLAVNEQLKADLTAANKEIERLTAIRLVAYEACCTGDSEAELKCIALCDEFDQDLKGGE